MLTQLTIMNINMNVWTPKHIRQLRKTVKLTQESFAEMIGVTRVYVNLLEKGVKTPSKMLCILLTYIERFDNENERRVIKRGKGKRDL